MSFLSYPILIIDEDKEVLAVLKKIMSEERYQVYTASTGHEALKILESTNIDLILCDQRLPDMKGIEVLKKSYEMQKDRVRILFTANTDQETAVQAINIGHVSQFISKPWNDATLKQTVKVSLEKLSLEKEMQLMQELIVEHHKELAKAHKILKGQLEIGAKIHETLLLGQVPSDVPGVSVQASTIPSHEIDGDFFEFYRPLKDVLDIVVGDVMGKGIPAALVGTAVKTQLLRFAIPESRRMIFDEQAWWREDISKIETILANVHKAICSDLIKLEYFVSLFYARIDLNRRVLSFVDCGFTKPIHWHAEEKKATFLRGDNFPLGMVIDEVYKPHRVSFREKDIFVFYSDGLSEARASSGEFFETDRLIETLKKYEHENADVLLNKIRSEVKTFHGKEVFDDDLSLIVIKIEHYVENEYLSQRVGNFASDLSQLEAVRDFIGRTAGQCPGNYEKISEDLKLAINEIFCNIVKHGHRNKIRRQVVIQAEYGKEGIHIEVSDQGHAFNPLEILEPSLYGDKDDGYGWYIIRQLVDNVVYLPKLDEDGWNHLRVYKKYFENEVNMDIDFNVTDHALVLTPRGENLDAKEAQEFKERVFKLIEENKKDTVIFNMSELKFIDSSGLGCFLSILRKLNAQGGELKLTQITKPVKSMFELVSMHKIFEIYPTAEEALKVRK